MVDKSPEQIAQAVDTALTNARNSATHLREGGSLDDVRVFAANAIESLVEAITLMRYNPDWNKPKP